jgi:hypothetical protein
MLAVQILSIVAFLVSWLWYVTLVIASVAVTLVQVTWCCHIKKTGLIVAIVICSLASAGCIVAGILMIVQWKGDTYCHVFTMNDDVTHDDFMDDDTFYIYRGDYCNEVAWAVVAFVTGALWAAAAICTLYFLTGGRYQRCEEECSRRLQANEGDGNEGQDLSNIEMGSIVPVPAATPYLSPGEENHEIAVLAAASFIVSDDVDVTTKEE